MATGPCLGCGFSIDDAGDLQITGVSNKDWPYTAPGHIAPDGWYCDTGPDGKTRLWHQPWNLPWGIVGRASGSGTGVYANGYGPQQVCGITVTLIANRIYRMTGSFAYQCDVATLFEQSNPYKGATAGGVIWNWTTSTDMVGQSQVSARAGFGNFISLSRILEPTSTIVRNYSWRSYAFGLMNCRPLQNDGTFLMIEDCGPRF